MHIVIHDGDRGIRSADIPLDVECVRCGSDPEGHVYLPDVRVAERHFEFRKSPEGCWQLHTCEFAAGTPADYTRIFVNALELTEPRDLKHNDEIVLARFRLKIFLDEVFADAPRSAMMEEVSRIRAHPLPSGAIVRNDPDPEIVLLPGAAGLLAKVAFEIHECLDLATLMHTAIMSLMRQFNARQVWFGARRHGYGRLEFIETKLASGNNSDDPPRLETFEFRCGERGQFICCPQAEVKGIESLMCIPLITGHGILGLMYVDNKENNSPYGDRELDLFSALGAVIARQLELVVRNQIKLQEAIVAGELSFMRELQAKMDPTNVPQWDGLQMAMYCKPGLDSASDIYDVMRLPNGLAAFFCGRVSGGITRAGLAMAEARAAFRMGGLHADPPHVLLRALNWMMYDPKQPTTICAAGLVMNPKTGAMQYASAGRAGAVIIDGRGSVRDLVQPSIPEVGSTKDYAYTSGSGRLDEGETMVLFSPGTLTIADQDGQQLGVEAFHDALSDGFGQTASAALNDLLSDLRAFFSKGRQPDDITIMLLHRG